MSLELNAVPKLDLNNGMGLQNPIITINQNNNQGS